MGITNILRCLRKEVSPSCVWDGLPPGFEGGMMKGRYSSILEYNRVFISCLTKFLTFLSLEAKYFAWHTTLRYNHFICENEDWKKKSLKGGNLLKETSEPNKTHKGGGGVRHLRVHAGIRAN